MRIRDLAKYCYLKSLNAVRSIDAGSRSAALIDLEDIRDKLNANADDKEKKWQKKLKEKSGRAINKKLN